MIEWLENEPDKVWCAYRPATGQILGEVRHDNEGFQVWLIGAHARFIRQGWPHTTLNAAKADLADFLK